MSTGNNNAAARYIRGGGVGVGDTYTRGPLNVFRGISVRFNNVVVTGTSEWERVSTPRQKKKKKVHFLMKLRIYTRFIDPDKYRAKLGRYKRARISRLV